MKKLMISIIASMMILSLNALPVFAAVDGTSVFDGNSITSDFDSSTLAKQIGNLQPGDSVNFSVAFKNESSDEVNLYMLNDVLDSLEELNGENSGGKEPKNGAYTYVLSYTSDGDGIAETIFSNDSVGGDRKATVPLTGLHQATNATGEYFYLTHLKKNQSAKVHLRIKLDPETENNSYMDTDAKVKVSFAVEKAKKPPKTTPPADTPKTGDYLNMRTLITLICAAVLLALVVASYIKDNRREDNE